MNFNEFAEAVARLAERCSFKPLEGAFKEEDTPEEYTTELRHNLPLHIKIESFIAQLYDPLMENDFKKNNPKPTHSFMVKHREYEAQFEE